MRGYEGKEYLVQWTSGSRWPARKRGRASFTPSTSQLEISKRSFPGEYTLREFAGERMITLDDEASRSYGFESCDEIDGDDSEVVTCW